VADSRSRDRRFIVAFTVIIAISIGDVIDEGSDVWDWIVIGICAAFLLQSVYRLRAVSTPPGRGSR
jgi:hypothetical protein